MTNSALVALLAAVVLLVSPPAQAQARKDSLTLAMTLEPTGLDPTAGAASSIGEVVLYELPERRTLRRRGGEVQLRARAGQRQRQQCGAPAPRRSTARR